MFKGPVRMQDRTSKVMQAVVFASYGHALDYVSGDLAAVRRCGPCRHDRRQSDNQMDLLATWYAQKAQNGTMSQVCVLVAFLVSELRSQVGWPKLFLRCVHRCMAL